MKYVLFFGITTHFSLVSYERLGTEQYILLYLEEISGPKNDPGSRYHFDWLFAQTCSGVAVLHPS